MRRRSRVLAAGTAAWVAACAWPLACGAEYSWQVSSAYQQLEFGVFHRPASGVDDHAARRDAIARGSAHLPFLAETDRFNGEILRLSR
jgi:hypothetical protein